MADCETLKLPLPLSTLKRTAACFIFHLASKKGNKPVVYPLAVEPPLDLSQIWCYSEHAGRRVTCSEMQYEK